MNPMPQRGSLRGGLMRTLSARDVRTALSTRQEIALLDLRSEARFASGHPLFAAQLASDQIELEAPARLPRLDVPVVLYDDRQRDGERLVEAAIERLQGLGYRELYALAGNLEGWRAAGFELFQDVNSYSKAFGELVESRRYTPSLSAHELHQAIVARSNLTIVDARSFDEYHTMSIPGATNVPGAELVLRAPSLAPDPETLIVVSCAGRTRSILGAQSLLSAGIPNPVVALRNGTIGWTLAGKTLGTGQTRVGPGLDPDGPALASAPTREAQQRARAVAYRAGVRRLDRDALAALVADRSRTLYRFDVRTPAEYAAGHLPGFRSAPGGQLVQETDVFAPVRGARIVLADPLGARADVTASWLAQMAWEVYVLDDEFAGRLESGAPPAPKRADAGRYKRPYEGADNPRAAFEAYLQWEHGLLAQLERDQTHGFFVT